jgi:hypothetical protein
MTPKHLSRSGEGKANPTKATRLAATLITSWLPNARQVGISFLKKAAAGAVAFLALLMGTVSLSIPLPAQTSEAH